MKVLLINDTTKWYHFGCTATSTALIEGIKKLGHDVTAVPITETYKIKAAPKTHAGFLDPANYKDFISQNKDLIDMIKIHDAIVLNGEGTLHGLNPAPVSLLYLAYIAREKMGKHVEIINHSAYPQHDTSLGNTEEAAIYKLVYNTIDFAAIREPVSFTTMAKLGVPVLQSFDCMPLYIRDHYQKTDIKHDKELLIAGSATWLQINLPSNEKGNIEDFTTGLSGFNKYLNELADEGFKIKFLYGAEKYPAKDDREFIEYMKQNFGMNLEVYEAKSLTDWLQTIEQASLMVSGRFHHTIAAAILNTQFIALNSNTPKIEGLLQVLGTDEVIKYNDDNIYDKLLALTSHKIDKSFRSVHNGNDYLPRLCDKADNNFASLKKNDLGIGLLAAGDLLEYSPIIKYLLKEVIFKYTPFSDNIEKIYTNIPSSNTLLWGGAHFACSVTGVFLIAGNNPKISLYSKISFAAISSTGYVARLKLSEEYSKIAESRIAIQVSDSNQEYDLFESLVSCLPELALATASAFIVSSASALQFSRDGSLYTIFSSLTAATSGLIHCLASANKISAPDSSFTGKVIPYVADAAATYSLVSSMHQGAFYALPDIALEIKKALFGLGLVVYTDQLAKSIVALMPNDSLEYLDGLFGMNTAENAGWHSEF